MNLQTAADLSTNDKDHDLTVGQLGSTLRGKFAAALIVAIGAMAAGCGMNNEPPAAPKTAEQQTQERLAQVRDVGNGVFEIPASNDIAKTVADFRKEHPELRIIGFAPSRDRREGFGRSSISRIDAYMLITEPAEAR